MGYNTPSSALVVSADWMEDKFHTEDSMSPITLTITLNTREWDPVASAFSSRKLVRLFLILAPAYTMLFICLSVHIYKSIHI